MRIDLCVPYDEHKLAKSKGARWDPARKTWYIENPENIFDFVCWAPERMKQATISKPLEHKPFKVTQPRTPTNKERRKFKLKKNALIRR